MKQHRNAHIWPRAELCCPGASGLGRWWRSGCLFHSCWPECFWWVKIRESSKGYSNLNHSKLFWAHLLLLQVLLQLLRPPLLQLQLLLLLIRIKDFVYIAFQVLMHNISVYFSGTINIKLGGTNLSKKAASSLLSRTLCLVPALTWQFISWARDIYTEVPAKSVRQANHLC